MTPVGRFAAFSLVALAIAAVATPRILSRLSHNGDARASTSLGQRSTRKPTVVVYEVRSAPLTERLATTGTLRANEQIAITTELSGKVAAIRFREGAAVRKGDVLLEIDANEIETQRKRAFHRAELARKREARERRLLEDGLISSQEYDFARTDLDVLETELALVDARLEKTSVRAPFGGIVGLRFISPGAYVTPQTRIASLQDLDPMKVDFAVPERYASRVKIGQRVEIKVAGLKKPFEAAIYAIEPAVEASTRSLVVRARFPNPLGTLRPGAFADVSVIITEVPEALTVPSVAVIPELGGKKVFVVEEGVVAARSVETGIRTEKELEITSGLKAGDRVVIRGLEAISHGSAVEVLEEAGPAPPASL